MILKIEVPFLDTHVPGGVVRTWFGEEGQEIGFGDPLCDIVAEDYVALQRIVRPYNAASLVRRAASRVSRRQNYHWKRGRVELVYRVVASEAATLGSIRAPEGSPVKPGDLLALASTQSDDPKDVGGDFLAKLPLMKVVATHVELSGYGSA